MGSSAGSTRRVWLVSLLVAGCTIVIPAANAPACSCASPAIPSLWDSFTWAAVGTVTTSTEAEVRAVPTLTVKGTPPSEVSYLVTTGAFCGSASPRRPVGASVALLGDGDQTYVDDIGCGARFTPQMLRAYIGDLPPKDGRGPPALVVGGWLGPYNLIILDVGLRPLHFLAGDAQIRSVAVCPGGARAVAFGVKDDGDRWRGTASLLIVNLTEGRVEDHASFDTNGLGRIADNLAGGFGCTRPDGSGLVVGRDLQAAPTTMTLPTSTNRTMSINVRWLGTQQSWDSVFGCRYSKSTDTLHPAAPAKAIEVVCAPGEPRERSGALSPTPNNVLSFGASPSGRTIAIVHAGEQRTTDGSYERTTSAPPYRITFYRADPDPQRVRSFASVDLPDLDYPSLRLLDDRMAEVSGAVEGSSTGTLTVSVENERQPTVSRRPNPNFRGTSLGVTSGATRVLEAATDDPPSDTNNGTVYRPESGLPVLRAWTTDGGYSDHLVGVDVGTVAVVPDAASIESAQAIIDERWGTGDGVAATSPVAPPTTGLAPNPASVASDPESAAVPFGSGRDGNGLGNGSGGSPDVSGTTGPSLPIGAGAGLVMLGAVLILTRRRPNRINPVPGPLSSGDGLHHIVVLDALDPPED